MANHKYRYYVRKFLNLEKHHAGAHILASVQDTRGAKNDVWPLLELELSDCSKIIQLEFPIWSAHHRMNSVYKAQLLADITAEFAEAVAAEAVLAEKREQKRNRKGKKK